ncbi:MAG: hypothetical protein WBW47_01950 [Thermoplasmata archaeon]
MNPPGVGPFRTGASRSSPATDRAKPSLKDAARSVSPEEAPKQCSACSQPLSVGERMFYFLEGGGELPLCRACIVREQSEGAPGGGRPPALVSSKNVQYPDREIADDRAGSSDLLTDVVRSFLEEELDRFDSSLDRVPETHPDLALARGLEDEARQQLSSGRLADAVASLRDVRRILITLERGRKRSSLSAPWDESVEALFDRVLARARAMTRPGQPSPEEGGTMIPASMQGSSNSTGASS